MREGKLEYKWESQMKAGKVEPILKSSRDGKVAQQCIHEYFNLFTNIYTLYLNHTQTKYRRLIFTLKWNYLFGSFLGSHNIMTILSQGSLLVLIIRSPMGLLDQSKFHVSRYGVFSNVQLAKWTFCQTQQMYCTQKLGAHSCAGVEVYREFMLSDRRRSWGLTQKSSARW